jgi:hypothetical protein
MSDPAPTSCSGRLFDAGAQIWFLPRQNTILITVLGVR